MNKVFNINLGGHPIVIDADAYDHLDKYLKTIQRHFRNSEGVDEILEDIEARLAELILENMENRQIVTLKDIQSAIVVMGTPDEFGAEQVEGFEAETNDGIPRDNYRTGKRLFRNTDDEVIGGVASGIAAYFGINDPIWVRLAFVLITISGGFGIPLYIILWAVIPEAKTASDRLEMRGEPINVSNIGKIIEEEISHLAKKVTEFGDDINEKFGPKKKVQPEEIVPERP